MNTLLLTGAFCLLALAAVPALILYIVYVPYHLLRYRTMP